MIRGTMIHMWGHFNVWNRWKMTNTFLPTSSRPTIVGCQVLFKYLISCSFIRLAKSRKHILDVNIFSMSGKSMGHRTKEIYGNIRASGALPTTTSKVWCAIDYICSWECCSSRLDKPLRTYCICWNFIRFKVMLETVLYYLQRNYKVSYLI